MVAANRNNHSDTQSAADYLMSQLGEMTRRHVELEAEVTALRYIVRYADGLARILADVAKRVPERSDRLLMHQARVDYERLRYPR